MVAEKKFKALIVKPSSLGDIFHAFPAVAMLKAARPDAEMDWLVHPAFADALKYSPLPCRPIFFRRKELGAATTFLPHFCKLLFELRRERYDLAVDMQGLLRSAFFTWLARSHQTAGFAAPKEPAAASFYHSRIAVAESKVHAVDKNIELMRQLLKLSDTGSADYFPAPVMEFVTTADRLLRAAGLESAPLVGIIPGARWPSKCFPPAFFAKIIAGLSRLHPELKFIILGAKDDRPAAAEIISQAADAAVVSLAGQTGIGELVEVIRRCECVLSNDSGPIHIAAALRKSVFAFFGPTDPRKTGPYGNRHHIFQAELPCIRCLKRVCPRANECHQLEIDKILDTLNRFINTGACK